MTEKSWWWDGHTTGDASLAPYDADSWAEIEQIKFVPYVNYQGVIGGALNNLEVTSGGGAVVNVNTGAAIVNGRLYSNDASLSFNVNGASVWWLIGLFLDDSAQTVRAFARGTYATDALALASLVHIAGGDWEIPLATVLTTAGGAVSSITDHRLYTIRSSLSYLYAPATGGYNSTDSTDIVRNASTGVPLANNKICTAYGHISLPPNYWKTLTVKPICISGGNGDAYVSAYVAYEMMGYTYNAHTSNTGYAAVPVTGNIIQALYTQSLGSADEGGGDLLCCSLTRDAVNVLDTVNASLYLSGWLIQYIPLF